MKTVDLIPFILHELNECDKYGFELTKAIETKSNGEIIIKQPTLYTLLKKLEKSKFITSYWEDSEIGGKRHYYKLTENGKIQVSTLPPYSSLFSNSNVYDEENLDDNNIVSKLSFDKNESSSFMDSFLNKPVVEPAETILPIDEVFSDENIDSKTELDLNISNSQILKDTESSKDEEFATSTDVMKFTEKVPSSLKEIKNFSALSKIEDNNVNFITPNDDPMLPSTP